MKIEPDSTILLTGASGGLGTDMAHALARKRVNLALVAYPGAELENLKSELESLAGKVIAISADLRIPEERIRAVMETKENVGEIDILINNAGVEFTSFFHDLSEEDIKSVLGVNLEAPMILTKLVLPDMLQRNRGHIVNISSLAGKVGPAFQEPYAATKAGLIAFTASLRATYDGSGVSASVICPGFVETGIYARLKKRSGQSAPALLGTVLPEAVTKAVLGAIERDLLEVVVNKYPVRPLAALGALSPSLGAWIVRRIGTHDFFRRVIQKERQTKKDS